LWSSVTHYVSAAAFDVIVEVWAVFVSFLAACLDCCDVGFFFCAVACFSPGVPSCFDSVPDVSCESVSFWVVWFAVDGVGDSVHVGVRDGVLLVEGVCEDAPFDFFLGGEFFVFAFFGEGVEVLACVVGEEAVSVEVGVGEGVFMESLFSVAFSSAF
jgi:hypothetical protein